MAQEADMSPHIIEDAAREVFETTACMKAGPATHCAEAADACPGLIATIGLVGSNGGTLVVRCDWPVAAAVTAGMLGSNGEEPEAETVHDAMGEIVNQIGGVIKRSLGTGGGELVLSVPVVASGRPLSSYVKSSSTPLRVDLDLNGDKVSLSFWSA